MVVSNLITSLVGEFFLQYSGIAYKSVHAHTFPHSWPLHLTVAHAGLVGCLIGVALCSISSKLGPSALSKISNDDASENDGQTISMIASLFAVVGVTLGCLELALSSTYNHAENEYGIATSSRYAHGLSTTINWRLEGCIPSWIPRSVQWLFYFLSFKSNGGRHDHVRGVSRVAVLLYWVLVLTVSFPISLALVSWITTEKKDKLMNVDVSNGATNAPVNVKQEPKDQSNQRFRRGSNHCQYKKEKRQRVVIARKFFHIVGMLLFIPITWLDPDIMALSYAISVALLVVLEMVRGWASARNVSFECNRHATTSNGYAYGEKTDKPNQVLCSFNQWYMVFLDEKDSSAANGGLAVTHIALVAGCAFPLWIDQFLQYATINRSKDGLSSPSLDLLLKLLPFLGVLVLGIGDSAGAVGGMHVGRHRWPGGSSRTLEGSFCMFLSMMLVIFGIGSLHRSSSIMEFAIFCAFGAGVPLGIVTLIEASTTQIDNLCLPISSVSLFLLFNKS